MGWTVEFEPRAFAELQGLDRVAQRRITKFLRERISSRDDPPDLGKPLTGDKAGLWRYRVGDYRLICHLSDKHRCVLVIRMAHRKQAYR